MKIKSFEHKKFYSVSAGIRVDVSHTLFYIDGAQSICHLYEPIENSFYIIEGDFKFPYFKTENHAQKFLNRIKNHEVTA